MVVIVEFVFILLTWIVEISPILFNGWDILVSILGGEIYTLFSIKLYSTEIDGELHNDFNDTFMFSDYFNSLLI